MTSTYLVRSGASTFQRLALTPENAAAAHAYRPGIDPVLLVPAEPDGALWLLVPPSGAARHDFDGSPWGITLADLDAIVASFSDWPEEEA